MYDCCVAQDIRNLTEVVPACLTAACPALRTLTMTKCGFQATLEQQQQQAEEKGDVCAPSNVGTWPHLETLHLGTYIGLPVSLVTTALAALPTLTSLTLPANGTTGISDVSMALEASTRQLTHLAWVFGGFWDGEIKLPSFLATPAAEAKLARLQQLDQDGFDLDDMGLCAMMAHLPALTHVTVGTLQLQDNHAEAKMAHSWEELSVSVEDLTSVIGLAHLPLRSIKRVRVWGIFCDCDTEDDASSSSTTSPAPGFASALAAAPICSFTCRCDNQLHFCCPVSQLPAMLPLLARWEGVNRLAVICAKLRSEYLTPASVSALGALLEGMPSCTRLRLHLFIPSLTTPLVPALVRTSILTLRLTPECLSETHLALWCAGDPGSRCIKGVTTGNPMVHACVGNVRAPIAESGSAVQLVVQGLVMKLHAGCSTAHERCHRFNASIDELVDVRLPNVILYHRVPDQATHFAQRALYQKLPCVLLRCVSLCMCVLSQRNPYFSIATCSAWHVAG
jgi:hypothetical protein